MSGTTTVTAGRLTISGLNSAWTYTGGYSSAYTWATGTDLNVGATDTPINNTLTTSGSNDKWTLTVTINDTGAGAASDYLIYGTNTTNNNNSYVSGTGSKSHTHNGTYTVTHSGTSLTFAGTGTANLQTLLRGLTILDGGGDNLAVTFTLSDTTNNHTGTTTFTSYIACYATGARIAVPAGEIAVQDLTIGDLVVTADGAAKPVKWIGRRSYTAAQTAANKHLRPVIVRKGALADNMPHRDLTVSPMHGLFIDDVFVPAASLINGVTILRSEALEPVSYVHIELDDHDVVFAEGAPAETFVDDNSRLMFENADEYYDMFGADETPRGFSAPRIEHGYQLEAIRRRLAARAGLPVASAAAGELKGHVERLENGVLEGWVMDVTPNAAAVELDVLVEGEVVARVLANRYRTDLDHAGLAGGRCAFSVTLPASAVALSQVEIRRTIDGAVIPMPKIAALAA